MNDSDFIEVKELREDPLEEPIIIREGMRWPGVIMLLIIASIMALGLGLTIATMGFVDFLVPISVHNAQLDEMQNETMLQTGNEIIYAMTQRAVQCEYIPITTPEVNYTLFPVECLLDRKIEEVNISVNEKR